MLSRVYPTSRLFEFKSTGRTICWLPIKLFLVVIYSKYSFHWSLYTNEYIKYLLHAWLMFVSNLQLSTCWSIIAVFFPSLIAFNLRKNERQNIQYELKRVGVHIFYVQLTRVWMHTNYAVDFIVIIMFKMQKKNLKIIHIDSSMCYIMNIFSNFLCHFIH